MARAIILLMDSFGIGGAPDAEAYGSLGANTLGHVIAANGGLKIPNLNFFFNNVPIKYATKLKVTPANIDSLKKSFIPICLLISAFSYNPLGHSACGNHYRYNGNSRDYTYRDKHRCKLSPAIH